jgi:predicted Zn-dependent peptidase
LPVIEHRLANGLRVVLQPDPNARRVAVAVSYRVGSRDDPDGYHGLAHLLEHMMFEGSRNVPAHAFHRHLEAAGVTERNGMTSSDHTTYFEVLPARALPLALWLESDRMAYLLDRASDEGLDRQRRVVVHEWNERTGTVSGGRLPEIVASALYPAGHPYRRAADDPDDVEAAELRHVQHFFQRWYAPDNATLAVVGAFDAERARILVERWFGPIRPTPGLDRVRAMPAPVILPGERRLVVEAPVPRSSLIIAWNTPPYLAAGDAELDLAANLLDERRGNLRRRLVDEERLARSVTATQDSRELGSTFLLDIGLEDGADPERVLAIADEELERLRMAPPDPGALRAAVAGHQRGVLLAASELATRAIRMAQWRTPDGSAYRPSWDLGRFAVVSGAAVQQAIRVWLPRDRRVIVRVVADDGADILGDVVDREETPAP